MKIQNERISAREYMEFLTRTDLGSQYPKERFPERIEKLVQNAAVSLTARDGDRLVGVCFAITDFAYWMFLTDLGVDREYTGRGIGRTLVERAVELAGGDRDIILYTLPHEKAVPFYEKLGFTPASEVIERNRADWTSFTVDRDYFEKVRGQR